MHEGHYIEYCTECRGMISTCRCPSKDKEVRYGICNNCRKTKDADIANVTPLGIGTLTTEYYKCRYCDNDSITRSDNYCGKCGKDLAWDKCDE